MLTRTYGTGRDRILDAAETVLVSRGPKALSVDAVVHEARISKGGFFYHFATKDDLLVGLTQRIIAQHQAEVEETASSDPVPQGRNLRSFLRFAFEVDKTERFRRLMSGFLVLAGESPGIQSLVQGLHEQMREQADRDGIPLSHYLLVHLAMDGFWMGSALGTRNLSEDQARELERMLLRFTLGPFE